MPTHEGYCYSDTCAALNKFIQDCNVKIKLSEQNYIARESFAAKIQKSVNNITLCNMVLENCKPILEDILQYRAERTQESMRSINNALRLAGDIIPEATEGILVKFDGDEAWVSTPDGLEVDRVEGGGYRQISSTFLRSVVLNANSNNLQTMFLDEIFSLVSPENSATLSLMLNIITQDKQVISIEQKPQVYSNIDCTMYTFSKDKDYTEVAKKEISRNALQTNGSI